MKWGGNNMALEVEKFAKGFVAALVELDQTSIQPKSPEHRRALNQLYKFIAEQVELARDKPLMRNWFKDVVRLRNSLSPGQTGAFDQFETALRDLQLSFTEFLTRTTRILPLQCRSRSPVHLSKPSSRKSAS